MRRWLARLFPVGTRSVLFGAHCFFIHPWFVAAAWWRLYSFPWDPRLWVAFVVHDWGYWGKRAMDDEEGERHVELGARIMARLFDRNLFTNQPGPEYKARHLGICFKEPDSPKWCSSDDLYRVWIGPWGCLSLLHSRFYARKFGLQPSRLCAADKLAMALEPWWLYLPRVIASGEIHEYMAASRAAALGRDSVLPSKYQGEPACTTKDEVAGLSPRRAWFIVITNYCRQWALEHADGRQDTWTPAAKQETR